jgi:hypothetical protein
MNVDDAGNRIVVTTTAIHLPRRIGEALKSAFDGELSFKYNENGYFFRVDWRRDVPVVRPLCRLCRIERVWIAGYFR